MFKKDSCIRVVLVFVCVFTSEFICAQLYTPSGAVNSNTGGNDIGIGEDSPMSRLHIRDRKGVGLLLDVGVGGALPGGGYEYTEYPFELRYTDNTLVPAAVNVLKARLHNTGRLDLGLDFSGYPVDVVSRLNLLGGLHVFTDQNSYSFLSDDQIKWSNTSSNPFKISFYDQSTSTESDAVIVSPDGRMSINAENPVGDFHLVIGGKVLTEELTVKLQQDWPDYVFSSDYKRKSLDQIERYIKDNGKLPGVPSAEEVKSQGLRVGEMEIILLEKIEELTLELIELNDKLETLQAKLKKCDSE